MIRFRGDIEGLRAVAVLVVILNHLQIRGFGGGFTGVDVFFVISGYLITSLLAAEYARKATGGRIGSISIAHFYLRRARRILPAALAVTGAIVVASHLFLNVLRVQQVQHDAIWATLFASNVNFIRQSTDYFAAAFVTSSPFGHYWSLSVEEQFYFVWPALFLLVVALRGLNIRGFAIGWRVRLGITLGLVGAGSLAWSILDTSSDPASAYYSTFTRAWELALGAIIGVATTGATRIDRRWATAASSVGAAFLLAGFAVIDATSTFPGYVALLPTVGAALLIIGGLTQTHPAPNRLLGIAPMRFVGRISYSLYLWHWPLIVFAAAMYPNAIQKLSTRLGLLGLTVGIATVSYYLIEQPFRRGPFPRLGVLLEAVGELFEGRSSPRLRVAVGVAAVATACVGIGALAQFALSPKYPQMAYADGLQVEPAEPIAEVTRAVRSKAVTRKRRTPKQARTASGTWHAKVEAALTVKSLPSSLQPISRHLGVAPALCDYRLDITAHAGECTWGNPTGRNVAAITGDSHASMWVKTVEGALDPKTWSLHGFTRSWCGWAADASLAVGENKDCPALQAQTLAELAKLHVDVLFVSESSAYGEPEMRDALERYAKVARTVVVIGVTPRIPSFNDCLRGSADISDCYGNLTVRDLGGAYNEQRVASESTAQYIDTTSWFCYVATDFIACPPVIDNAPVFADGNHLTSEIAGKLGPVLRETLLASRIIPAAD